MAWNKYCVVKYGCLQDLKNLKNLNNEAKKDYEIFGHRLLIYCTKTLFWIVFENVFF